MDNKRITNALLFVIATCLALIAAKLYDGAFVAEAHAQQGSRRVIIEGCFEKGANECEWIAVQVDSAGYLLTRSAR